MNRPLDSGRYTPPDGDDMPIVAVDMPVMYEDEGQEEMGETDIHWRTCDILRNGLAAHLRGKENYRVFSDLNVYYHPMDRWAYVSPDVCAVNPPQPLPDAVASYRIDDEHPAPVICVEAVSRRSGQQQDLTTKPEIYARHGVLEYVLVDVTGDFFPQRLVLRQLDGADGAWIDRQDEDGSVTSRLGVRIIIDDDGMVRVVDAATGKKYVRPEEAQESLDAAMQLAETERQAAQRQQKKAQRQQKKAEQDKQAADERIRQLEEELRQLRGK